MSWKANLALPLLSGVAPWKIAAQDSQRVLIVAYHRICEVTDDFPYDEGVVSAGVKDFAEQVRFFKQHFSVITFAQLREAVHNGQGLPPRALIITFDDGYRDNYTHAFPVLKKYGVPATVFLTVNNIESGEPYWWDQVAFCLKAQGKNEMDIHSALKDLKNVSDDQRRKWIRELIQAGTGMEAVWERQSLTWEEVREMSEDGIEFGSHTMTHPVLSMVADEQDLDHEIRESKRIIEQRLGKGVTAFSYPVGGKSATNGRVAERVKAAGYDFAVTYQHGVNDMDQADPFCLKRLDMDKEKLTRIKAKLAFPELFQR